MRKRQGRLSEQVLGTGEERVHSWAREKVKETEVSTGRTGVKSQSNRVRGVKSQRKQGAASL